MGQLVSAPLPLIPAPPCCKAREHGHLSALSHTHTEVGKKISAGESHGLPGKLRLQILMFCLDCQLYEAQMLFYGL